MNVVEALRMLAPLTATQWGMVTTAQAESAGVSRLALARLTEAGHLERLAQGVYRDTGAPSDEFEALRAAWLSTQPADLAEVRLRDAAAGVVVCGASAARLHQIGDLPADRHEFSSPSRRQTQRPEIHYRCRYLDPQDVTLVNGIPVTTKARTVADLVESRVDFSLVADALGDALRAGGLDLGRLQSMLAPLAARNGFSAGDGAALLDHLIQLSGTLRGLSRAVAQLTRSESPDLASVAALAPDLRALEALARGGDQ